MSVVIVRVGACTAVGLDARQTGFVLRAGFPAMTESPLCNAAGEAITAAFVPTIDARLTGAERVAVLARGPFEEAIEPVRDLAASVHVGIDEGCLDAPFATRLLETMIKGAMREAKVTVEARGEAAPSAFVPAAVRALEARHIDVAVIGGAHSDHDPRAIAALEASGRLFSRDNLDARIPGEAAAFFVMMREADARRQRLSPLARVLGVGTGREQARPDNDDLAYPAFGMTAAVREATAAIAADGLTAGWFLTDLTSEMRRQYEWQTTFVRAQKVLGSACVIDAPAQRIGYLGAAAIPLFVAMAATAWEHGYAPSPVALAVAGTDGGERVALVLGEVRA